MEYFKQWVIYTQEETDGVLLWETSAVVVPKYGTGMHSWTAVQQLLQNWAEILRSGLQGSFWRSDFDIVLLSNQIINLLKTCLLHAWAWKLMGIVFKNTVQVLIEMTIVWF